MVFSRKDSRDDLEAPETPIIRSKIHRIAHRSDGKPTPPASFNVRLALIVIASLQSLLTSGVIFGWAPLQLMLQSEGQFRELCPSKTPADEMCPEQAAQFNLIFTIASSAFAISVWPTGALLDKFGPRISCLVGSILFGVGSFLFAISNSMTFNWFTLSYTLMAIGGPPIVFSFMHLSNLFPMRKATIIAILNVMIDASSLIFVLFKVLWSIEALQASRRALFIAYCVVPAASFLSAFWLWPMKPYASLSLEDILRADQEQDSAVEIAVPLPEEDMFPPPSQITASEAAEEAAAILVDGFPNKQQQPQYMNTFRVPRRSAARRRSNSVNSAASSVSEYSAAETSSAINPLAEDFSKLKFRYQLRTKAYLFAAAYTSLQLLHVNFYIGTVNDQLTSLRQSADTTHLWQDAFGWVLPLGGIASIPLVGYFLDKRGLVTSMHTLTVTAILFSAFAIPEILPIQAVTFALMAFFRAFLFSAMSAYCAVIFGFANFGKLWGSIFTLSGIINMGEYAAVRFINEHLNGIYFWPNVGLLALSVVLAFFPIWLHLESKRAQETCGDDAPILNIDAVAQRKFAYATMSTRKRRYSI